MAAKLGTICVESWLVVADKKLIIDPFLEEFSALLVDAVLCLLNTWEGDFWAVNVDNALWTLLSLEASSRVTTSYGGAITSLIFSAGGM